jgi:hypothetical protein
LAALIDQLPYVPLSAAQAGALAQMGVQVYVRRHPPAGQTNAVVKVPVAPDASLLWDEHARQSVLARALATAAGSPDVGAFMAAWLASGQSLPDLALLRRDGAGKRAFWRLLRARLRATPP